MISDFRHLHRKEVRVFVDWANQKPKGGVCGILVGENNLWITVETPGEYATEAIVIRKRLIGQIELVRPVEERPKISPIRWVRLEDSWHRIHKDLPTITVCGRAAVTAMDRVYQFDGVPLSDGHPLCKQCDPAAGRELLNDSTPGEWVLIDHWHRSYSDIVTPEHTYCDLALANHKVRVRTGNEPPLGEVVCETCLLAKGKSEGE